MRKAVLALALCACSEGTKVSSLQCELPCYTGPVETSGVGLCRAGTPECGDGGIKACVGEVLPAVEVCDGLDNDCDGLVDYGYSDFWRDSLCGPRLGACHAGRLGCVNGAMECLGAAGPDEEVCNRLDDDCDGLVDNIKLEVCYEGDPIELTYRDGECRAGVWACSNEGELYCDGQVLPSEEECGAGLDSNCNGVTDDAIQTSTVVVDVVIIWDRSGSMGNYDIRVQQSLVALAQAYAQANVLFTVVDLPCLGSVPETPCVVLGPTDGVELETFARGHTVLFGGLEASWDALGMIGEGDEDLGVSVRDGSKRLVFFFGDERGQGDFFNEEQAARALRLSGWVFGGFVGWGHDDDYDDIATLTGGFVLPILTDPVEASAALVEASSVCE